MFDLSYFKVGDVLNVAITRLRLSKVGVLVDNTINIPLLELSRHGYNTASTMLDND